MVSEIASFSRPESAQLFRNQVGDLDAARGVLQHLGSATLGQTGGCSFRTPFMVSLRSGQYQVSLTRSFL